MRGGTGAFDRFLIAPFNSGLQTDLAPWILAEDAFTRLNNAYIRHGRLNKRFGSRLMGVGEDATAPLSSRLRIQVDTTDGAGSSSGATPISLGAIGQIFSIGDEIFTVHQATGTLYTDGGASTHTFDTTNGIFVFTGVAALTPVFWYSSNPVMGFFNYESNEIANRPLYAFDTQFVYIFSGNAWARNGTTVWHGSNSDFFWSTNWTGANINNTYTFTTNFQVTNKNGAVVGATDDPMYYFNGSATWTAFYPKFLTTNERIFTSRIIIPFRDRLVLLNTVEQDAANTSNIHYPNRCRFSHNGSPLAASAYLEPNQAAATGGGYIDAPTKEAITSAEFIRDRLIVHFEKSVWELAYTGNHVLPFLWQQLNTELGSESTFSSVGFDKHILTIGTTGIHACNGVNVDRIDGKINEDVFNLRNRNNGKFRVAAIRDYFTEMVYWTYPSLEAQPNADTYPDKILVYNYKNQTWAYNDDTFTAFGYFEQQIGKTWADVGGLTWAEAGFEWSSGVTQSEAKKIVAGNQQGFCFLIEPTGNRNAPSLQITDMTVGDPTVLKIIDHTLQPGDFIYVENVSGATLADGIYKVLFIENADEVQVDVASAGVYTGAGTAARVSRVDIKSKEWNPYIKEGRDVFLSRISFYVTNTPNSKIRVDSFVSSSGLSLADQGALTNTLFGEDPFVLDLGPYASLPFEATQQRFWHNLSFDAEGENIQIRIYYDDDQMADINVSLAGLELHGFVLYTLPTSSRIR